MDQGRRYQRRFPTTIITLLFIAMLPFQNCGKFQSNVAALNSTNGSNGGPSTDSKVVSIPIPTSPALTLSATPFFNYKDRTDLMNFKFYEPQYPLFSDFATKKRWVYIPPNSQINTLDLDNWVFPKGTILWKEFSIYGKKIETRIMEKLTDGAGQTSWRQSVYLWRKDQLDADFVTVPADFYTNVKPEYSNFAAMDVADSYKIVPVGLCFNCHTGGSDVALGFNYFQLSSQKQGNVMSFRDDRLLSNPPTDLDRIAGTPEQVAGVGYMQGNCVHCHHGRGPAPHSYRHVSSMKAFKDEALVTEVTLFPNLIKPGDPTNSLVMIRYLGAPLTPGGAATRKMPPLGVSKIDPVGQSAFEGLINNFLAN